MRSDDEVGPVRDVSATVEWAYVGFMRNRLLRIVGPIVVSAAIVAGCGGSADTEPTAGSKPDLGLPTIPANKWTDETGKSSIVIDTRDNVFVPENIVVSPGTKIVFENTGRNPHNVIPGDKKFFAEIPVSKLQPKDKATLTIADEGEYPYYCSLHGTLKAGMRGRIKVEKG
ncbi:MAG: plastocyanin/azurin family copper-binding protein [Microthrixaceae bacterium]